VNRFCLTGKFPVPVDQTDGGRQGNLELIAKNLHPSLGRWDFPGRTVHIWGDPALDNVIAADRVAKVVGTTDNLVALARSLDGCFLIFVEDHARGRLRIVNDRFASFALYYGVWGGRFRFSTSFKHLLDEGRAAGAVRIAPAKVYEFLHLRRLLGVATLAEGLSALDSASVLTVDQATPVGRVEKYWKPNLAYSRDGRDVLAERLAEALQRAMALAMSDGGAQALLLSGGLDARALLAAAPRPPVCLTTALTDNNEVAVARDLAGLKGAEHRYVARPPTLYGGRVDDAVFLGGMQSFVEAQFLGYGDLFEPLPDVLHLGLGLDIFFGGLYQPKSAPRFAGRSLLHYALRPLPDGSEELARAYLGGVGYRLKTTPITRILAVEAASYVEALHGEVTALMRQAQDLGGDAYAAWEYMHLHNLSRHYSFPMAASIRTFARCRIPALTAELFDLAFALRPEDKANSTVYLMALKRLAPALMAVRNANTNLPAHWPLSVQSVMNVGRSVANRVGAGLRTAPPWWERSWPPQRAAISENPDIGETVRALPRSDVLGRLGFLDMDGIGAVVAEHMAGSADHAAMLNLLVTLEHCLREPAP